MLPQYTVVPGTPMEFHIQSASATSLVVKPTGSTYTAEFSCTKHVEGTEVIWLPIPNMTAATTLQSVELGPVTRIRVTATGGTNCKVDIVSGK